MVSGPGLRQPPRGAAPAAVLAGGMGRGQGELPPDRGPDRPGDRVHPRLEGGRAREAVLHVLLPRRLPRPAPRAEGVDRQVQGQVRHGVRQVPRARLRPPEEDGDHAGRRRAVARQPVHRREEPRRQAVEPRRRDPAVGLPVGRREGACSPGWPRSTPASCRTSTTTSAACSTTSRRPASSTTRSSSSCRTTARRGEGGPNGSVNENKFFNGVPDQIEDNLPFLDKLGSPETYNHYPTGWAWAFNTPFKMWKRYNFEGGIADPLVISWPKGIKAQGEIRHQYNHATDIVPTIYDCLGIELPGRGQGLHADPARRAELPLLRFENADAPTEKETGFFTMLGSRAIWHKGWKAVAVHPTIAGWGDFGNDRWELYDTTKDRTETTDLAAQYPEKVQELVNLWYSQAGMFKGLPHRRPDPGRDHQQPTRPQMSKPRDRYIYYPDCAEVPETIVGQHPEPLVHHRGRGDHRHARGGRRAVLARRAIRRSLPVHQGRQAQVRLQLRRPVRPGGRVGRRCPDRQAHPVGGLRPRGHGHAGSRHGDPVHR